MNVFMKYIQAMGIQLVAIWFLFYLGYQICYVVSGIWLSKWTDDSTLNNNTLVNTSEFTETRDMYLGIYGGFSAAQGRSQQKKLNIML